MPSRIKKIIEKLKENKISSFVVFKKEHIRYLVGLIVSDDYDAFCLIYGGKLHILTDFRYEEEAFKFRSSSIKIIINKGSKVKAISNILKNSKKIGFDSSLSVFIFDKLKKELHNNLLVPISKLIENISAVKDESEIKNIKNALRITEHVFEHHIIPIVKLGVKELDLSAEITYQHKLHGAEGDAFAPIVLSGARSSLPHGKPGNYSIKKGVLQFDFGCVVNGYCSDFSRVIIVGKTTKKQKEIYNIVLASQEKAIAMAAPFVKYCELDAVARGHINIKGYGKNFEHSLGHGIGITNHALPSVGAASADVITPGHVVTIEPGIYIPGWGGIRIEDMVLVKKDAVEVLTKFSKIFVF